PLRLPYSSLLPQMPPPLHSVLPRPAQTNEKNVPAPKKETHPVLNSAAPRAVAALHASKRPFISRSFLSSPRYPEKVLDQVSEVLLAQLRLQAVGHQRLAGGADLLNLAAQQDILRLLAAPQRDTRCRLGGDQTAQALPLR